jgi:hypothetical protein
LTAKKTLISIVGDGRIPQNHPKARLAEEMGRLLIDEGYRLACGGMAGVMEAACRGARSSTHHQDGSIIGILPGNDPGVANPYIDIPLTTGLDVARDILVAQSPALIAIGGGAGTLSEIAFGWMYERLILGFRVEGWSGQLADKPLDARERYPDIPEDRIFGIDKPSEAIALLQTWLPRYTRQSTAISVLERS